MQRTPKLSPPWETGTFDPKDPEDWFDWFVGVPLRVITIAVVGLIVLAILRRVIRKITDRIVAGGSAGANGDDGATGLLRYAGSVAGTRRTQRARTLGSVLRSCANVIVGVTVVAMILAELGVDIAPFLASAGIAGVALGFGAQSLVKDFLSGTFMLLEDQYGVGDVVDFGEVVGTVQEVALRVTKVRDADGTLWYLRNGEILRTGNKTQEWSRAVVEVRVEYDADIDSAREQLRQAAEDVLADPVLAAQVLEPPTVLGIEAMTAEGLVLRVQVKTRPGRQWEVARALRAAVRTHLTVAEVALAEERRVFVVGKPGAAGAAASEG